MQITSAQIKKLAPGARSELIDAIVQGWPAAERGARLNNPLRVMHFLSQIMVETGGLKVLSESGAYSYKSIMKIFGTGKHSAGVTSAEAKRIAALPVAQRGPVLFNRVYGVGNPKKAKEFDNHGPNDGWRYRGGGMLQATGKANYARLAKKSGLPLVEYPELLHQPASAFKSAWLVWGADNRANKAADADDEVACRKVINGGTNGLSEYRAYLKKARTIFAKFKPTESDLWHIDPVTHVVTASDFIEGEGGQPDTEVSSQSIPPVDSNVHGDPELWHVQRRLKAMNYNPGKLDGLWGGNTAGAIAGFVNDRAPNFAAPTSAEMFHKVLPQIKLELAEAETETPSFTRPVSAERAEATAEELAPQMPEVKESSENEKLGFWGGLVAFVTSVISGIVEFAGDAVEQLEPMKDFIVGISPYLFIGGILAVSIVMFWMSGKSGKAKDASVGAYREGART